jgi:hypothetical protein
MRAADAGAEMAAAQSASARPARIDLMDKEHPH